MKVVKASASYKITEGLGLVSGRYSNIIADKHAIDSPIEVKLGLKSAFCDMPNDKWIQLEQISLYNGLMCRPVRPLTEGLMPRPSLNIKNYMFQSTLYAI